MTSDDAFIDRLKVVAQSLIQLGDPKDALANLTGTLFATAVLLELSPTEVGQRMLDSCPDDDDWYEGWLPEFRSG